jgi:hypothetical protein
MGASDDAAMAVLLTKRVPVTLAGGGLALEVTTASVSSCVFEDNAAATTDFVLVANPDLPQARGGGLFMSSSVVAVSGCTFARNAAFYGGGVYAYNTTLTLSLSALARNIATLGDGGGLFASDCRAVSVTDSLVSGNAAGGHTGGGIAALNTPLTLLRSTLTENAASRGCGGSVGLDAAAWLILGGGTVISNSSARDGGGACCNLCLNATMANATFFANVATQGSGGAIFTGSTTTTVTNVTLFGNSAPTGGAISAVSSALTVTDCRLYNNTASATHGGAILHTAYDDSKQDLVLVNVALANNTCMSGGGAVAAFATRTAKFDNCRFDTNEINSQEPAGGAVLLLGVGRVFMYSCAFSYNKVRVLPAVVSEAGALLGFVSGVSASGTGLGGAVWIGTNTRCSANIVTSNFTRNGAPSGGAMYITGKVAITISESNFYHDHSSDWAGRGGAIVTDSTVVLDVIDSLFFSCEANMGGAGWHGGRSNVTYTNCIFEENEGVPGEDMKGTALQVTDSSRLVVAGSTFLNNMGTELAQGTVVLSGTNSSRLAITNTLFDGNFAFLGGCLFVVRCSRCRPVCVQTPDAPACISSADCVLAAAAAQPERRHLPQQLRVRRLRPIHRGGGLCTAQLRADAVRRRGGQLRIQLRPGHLHAPHAVPHRHAGAHPQRRAVAHQRHAAGRVRAGASPVLRVRCG